MVAFGPRLVPLLRIAVLLSALAALACAILLRDARAQVDETMLGFGSQAMAFPGAPAEEARAVQINGIEVSLRTQVVNAPLSDVLDRYRSVCTSSTATASGYAAILSSLAVRSASNESEGYVACVDLGGPRIIKKTSRFARFAESWDLGDLGSLRYAYAKRAEDRPKHETFVLTMWADASLDLRALLSFGADDARGTDLAGVPRPQNAQRILSATEAGAPAGVFVYRVRRSSTSEIARQYRRLLSENGWSILERSEGESIMVDGVRLLSAERAHRMVSVLAHHGEDGRTVVTLLAWEIE